jgi:hypothetical protein
MQTASMNQDPSGNHKPWYMHRWPWLLMLGPFLVVVAGTFTAWLAYSRQDALVVGDYYKQGQAINKDLRRDRIAARLGLHFNMRYDAVAGKLSGQLDALDAPQSGKLFVQLIHATLPQKDIKLVVDANERGAFTVNLPMLDASRWQVQVENEKRDWKLEGTWSWPQQRSIQIKADPAPAQ